MLFSAGWRQLVLLLKRPPSGDPNPKLAIHSTTELYLPSSFPSSLRFVSFYFSSFSTATAAAAITSNVSALSSFLAAVSYGVEATRPFSNRCSIIRRHAVIATANVIQHKHQCK